MPRPAVAFLEEDAARDPRLAGSKAAALAKALAAGLPVVPGFVVTTAETERLDGGGDVGDDVKRAWEKSSWHSVVVRSSSTAEDLGESSMAGRFESVVGVEGWNEFVDAVRAVLDSRVEAAAASDLDPRHPIAVLVQPLLRPRASGVLFAIDPVTGREDRIVVDVVAGPPEPLVSGRADATRYELDRRGREVERSDGDDGTRLPRRVLRALAEVARTTSEVFGGYQDLEWALEENGNLRLLQSRPVTTAPSGVPHGPVLGPGPVSETFPNPLARLERDLWVEPLKEAVGRALVLAGAAGDGDVGASPVVVSVGGRIAVDLELFGAVAPRRRFLRRLDVRPHLRRLRSATRVGRLRSALPDLADDLVHGIDEMLAEVPSLEELNDSQLAGLLRRARHALIALHGHELLMGVAVKAERSDVTAASVALSALREGRADGLSDDEIVARHPVVLALVPPQIGSEAALPEGVGAGALRTPSPRGRAGVLREALRLRVRWVQELTARAGWELGRRLVDRGEIDDPRAVRHLGLEDLEMLLQRRAAIAEVHVEDLREEPLPARFRLSDRGHPIPLEEGDEEAGTGAGGGRAQGRVHRDPEDVPDGAILVVRTLDPGLAPVLPRLAGLVSETGSVLAHVAILAREAGVPVVVGVAGATDRLEEGMVVEIDGTNGQVKVVDDG